MKIRKIVPEGDEIHAASVRGYPIPHWWSEASKKRAELFIFVLFTLKTKVCMTNLMNSVLAGPKYTLTLLFRCWF